LKTSVVIGLRFTLRRAQSMESRMKYKGGCHCGNLEIEFETSLNPAEIELRACQCTFCRKHGSVAVTDPAGHLAIRAAHGKEFGRYAFALRTAEFLICKTCGVYVAAMTVGESELRGIAIVNCLDDRRQFTGAPIAVDYNAESRDQRLERRRQRWTPVTVAPLSR
jgi:hypothetical protein